LLAAQVAVAVTATAVQLAAAALAVIEQLLYHLF
jgi:hypothetical protein